jgi:hypothetical protein
VKTSATIDLIPLNQITAASPGPANNITSILVYDQKPSQELVVLLNHMHASEKWVVIKLHVDNDIATSFRVIKVPCLVMYNSQQEETARVFGEQNILDLVQKVVE